VVLSGCRGLARPLILVSVRLTPPATMPPSVLVRKERMRPGFSTCGRKAAASVRVAPGRKGRSKLQDCVAKGALLV